MGTETASETDHLNYLDAVRGAAAFWVLFSHVAILNNVYTPLLTNGGLAVDLFMMLSGFLMTFHYFRRESREPFDSQRTWYSFWIRRFFRIAPLFYVLLAVAFIVGPSIGEFRAQIASVYPSTGTEAARYADRSVENIITHYAFVFALLPDYAFRTPLPDWSLGLEMTFYAVFPFVMLFWRGAGMVAMVLGVMAAAILLQIAFPGYFAAYQMPANLAMKMDVFLAGMLAAYALLSRDRVILTIALAILVLAAGLFAGVKPADTGIEQIALYSALCAVIFNRQIVFPFVARKMGAVVAFMDSRFFRFCGDTSYGVYLVHLFFVIPIIAVLTGFEWYVGAPGVVRVAVTLAATVAVVYPLAWVLHVAIEKPGIVLGRRVARMDGKSGSAAMPSPPRS